MTQQLARVTLPDIQRPVAGQLDQVVDELRRIIAADFPIIAEVNEHLLRMKGKLFRPTLLLLSAQATGGGAAAEPRVVTLAAIVELIHLATLVHDDSVDHSPLRRGMPTINGLFSHQVAVIMGDYLYSRAIVELVRLEDLAPLRVFARVTNEMTVGEMRQLEAHDKLAYGEGQYGALIQAKTASLLSGACEVGALRGAPAHGAALERMGPAERRRVAELMATAEPSDEQVAEVIRVVEAVGGLEYARRHALEHAQQAEAELETLPPSAARDALRDSITYAVERHS